MNLTLRLVTDRRSLILKQARPWVEKYPALPAPAGRSRVENAFYEAASGRPIWRGRCRALLGSDPSSGVLVLEDLGEARDFKHLYRQGELAESDLKDLVAFLATCTVPWRDSLTSRARSSETRRCAP